MLKLTTFDLVRDLFLIPIVGVMVYYLSDHPVPDSSDQLAVLAVGDQVEVVGELDVAGQFLQDVYAEAFAAQLRVRLCVTHNPERLTIIVCFFSLIKTF